MFPRIGSGRGFKDGVVVWVVKGKARDTDPRECWRLQDERHKVLIRKELRDCKKKVSRGTVLKLVF